MSVKIVIAGPRGKMGSEAVRMVLDQPEFVLTAVLDRKHDGKQLKDITEYQESIPVFSNLEHCLQDIEADVLIDLTVPEVGYLHTKTALNFGVRPVVGTTGFSSKQLSELKQLSEDKNLGGIIAPNFALGAVLMMKFSKMAAKYFEDVEIIEMHHDQKLDAPSGTALKTAEMIQSERTSKKQGHEKEVESIQGARGAELDGFRIHSVRLPGLVAHQQVMFGSNSQCLTIKHDSFHRESFMSGIKLSVETVMKIDTLVYGLENILD
ncbi:4-hydroxy-tetrahydrodipicolinate reductase [Bacillus sp. 2205SS5-2]|uniref:4-hydroxy-tetrahydrodipicolinate reductase n=1 Tax=Bacillus sp. 2205SS5-2 TaxID=3109031 RepID=UPI003005AF1B